MSQKVVLFWFRRDLRLEDNRGLFYALKEHRNVLPLFVYDTHILRRLPSKKDARLVFISEQIKILKQKLESMGSTLLLRHGEPIRVFEELLKTFDIGAVYTNIDYEPYGKERDARIKYLLDSHKVPFRSFKDHVIFEKDEVVKQNGTPYQVFTPYSRQWKKQLKENNVLSLDTSSLKDSFLKSDPGEDIPIEDMGFQSISVLFASKEIKKSTLVNYSKNRDFPASDGTSRLGVHLRFGTVSIRNLVRKAQEHSEAFLNELIWREFYMMILWHYPKVVDFAFKPAYDFVEWRNDENDFDAWCKGKTGYPIVDAGMRELNETGYMHNRARMITASFLTKHLLTDWRWGEQYFADKLLDFELSSNNGGWQWAAGSGCDAAPYFRVFNPEIQTKKFDPQWEYIRKWVPEAGSKDYPKPLVDHKFARERALEAYKKGLEKAKKEQL